MPKQKYMQRADGRYQSKIYLPDGKYKYVYAKSEKELKTKINDEKAKLQKGLDLSAENDTFGEWGEQWLSLKKIEVSHGRYNTCRYRFNDFTNIFNIPITKLRTADFQKIILQMTTDGYARKTILDAKNTASQICRLAIDNRVMDHNPVTAVKIPKQESTSDRRALTEEEQMWIINTPHRAQRAAMIMMFAGLRRGELIPLLWSDIDINAKTITINKAVEIINGKSVLKNTTKTKAGIRTVYFPQQLADYLKTELRGTSMYVCPDTKGCMMSESGWKRMWESYLTTLNYHNGNFSGLLVCEGSKMVQYERPDSIFNPQKIPFVIPRITAHWLRHTFITSMYLSGIDVLTAKEQAGHTNINTTLEIYTHLDAMHKEKQINKLTEYYDKLNVKMENNKREKAI